MSNEDHIFWRDARLPFVEVRKVTDGRQVCYAPHSHRQWSIGAINEGQSTFDYRGVQQTVQKGDLVLMNPNRVHACNPINEQAWAYCMVYLEIHWLTSLLFQQGLLEHPYWQDIEQSTIRETATYSDFCSLVEMLINPVISVEVKQEALEGVLLKLFGRLLVTTDRRQKTIPAPLLKVANHIREYRDTELLLPDLAALAGMSIGHFIRSFKKHYELSPHAYQVNLRVQKGQDLLKAGHRIVDAALSAGFSDQPHFQRTFKRHAATTPKHYAGK